MNKIAPEIFFQEEIQTYEKNKERLLKDGEGKYVLIKGNRIAGIYQDSADAVEAGVQIFGKVAMFVKKIEQQEQVFNFHRLCAI